MFDSIIEGIRAFFLILGPLVFVHELGHFLAAKWTGVHVEEFGLGFPPRLLRVWQGQGRLVLAGQTIIIPRSFHLPRVETGDIVDVVASPRPDGTLVLRTLTVHELAEDNTSAISDASPASPSDVRPAPQTMPIPAIASPTLSGATADERHLRGPVTNVERGTEYTLNLIPLGGFVRPKGEDDPTVPGGLAGASKRARFAVLVAGAGMNLITALVLFTIAFMTGLPDQPVAVHITEVVTDSPAGHAGLLPADTIVSVNGQLIKASFELLSAVDAYTVAHPGEPVTVVVMRADAPLTFQIVPRANPPAGQGKMGVRIEQESEFHQYTFIEAIGRSTKQVGEIIVATFDIPVRVIRGLLPADTMRPVSVVAISQAGAEIIRQSEADQQWWRYLQFTGFISIALAITNLLPLPALDGGRILFVLVEAVRGRRVSPERETMVHFIGMAMLLVLMLVLVVQDLLFPIKFGT